MKRLLKAMDFVTFEIAKKLVEKEFDWETSNVYERNTLACRYEDYPKPTISQVLKWLREEKEIYIVIEPFPTMATKNKICWGWSFKWHSDGIYIDHTFADDASYATYEEAAIAGIEYVLDNLF